MRSSIPRTMCCVLCFFPPDIDVVVDAEITAATVEEDNTVVEGIEFVDGRGVDKPVEVTALVCRIVVGDVSREALFGPFVGTKVGMGPTSIVVTLPSAAVIKPDLRFQ